jgi:hypothetical protein
VNFCGPRELDEQGGSPVTNHARHAARQDLGLPAAYQPAVRGRSNSWILSLHPWPFCGRVIWLTPELGGRSCLSGETAVGEIDSTHIP